MTKKDYELIAETLRDVREAFHHRWTTDEPDYMLENIAKALADVLAEDNPQFDRSKFLHVAGVDGY